MKLNGFDVLLLMMLITPFAYLGAALFPQYDLIILITFFVFLSFLMIGFYNWACADLDEIDKKYNWRRYG